MLTILLREGAIPMDILKKRVIIQTETINILKWATCNLKKTFPFDLSGNIGFGLPRNTVHFIFFKVLTDVHIKVLNTY